MVAGSVSRAARWTAATASPSETPGRRLNESVTAGIWPEWFTVSGPTVGGQLRHRASGTRLPPFERTR